MKEVSILLLGAALALGAPIENGGAGLMARPETEPAQPGARDAPPASGWPAADELQEELEADEPFAEYDSMLGSFVEEDGWNEDAYMGIEHLPRFDGFRLAVEALGDEALHGMARDDIARIEDIWTDLYNDPSDAFEWRTDPERAMENFAPPPPLSVSRKDGFTVHTHDAYPNYELRVKDPGPELGLDSVQQYSGYVDVLDEDKHFFFWLWESRSDPKNDDVVLWLNGGPGCSSATGEFFELGPSFVTTNLTTKHNPHAWNNNATVIFLDQPVNVGYSYSSKRVSRTTAAAEDVYAFLEVLFDALPKYANKPFHIAGESYAGKYLPAIGAAILSHEDRTFNLSSVLIGNPITDPAIQAFSSVAMACGDGGYPAVLEDETCQKLYEKVPKCENLLNLCYNSDYNKLVCGAAEVYCGQLEVPYLKTGRNPYDISDVCNDQCYPEIQSIEEFMRKPEVIEAVGSDVDDFVGCDSRVGSDFALGLDGSRNEGPDVLALLDAEVDVLFYDGALDWICSWPGVYRLVERLRYKQHAEFTGKPVNVWEVDGEPAGETKSAGHLSWMKVYGAGHMVPHDRGKQAAAMFTQWIKERKFTSTKKPRKHSRQFMACARTWLRGDTILLMSVGSLGACLVMWLCSHAILAATRRIKRLSGAVALSESSSFAPEVYQDTEYEPKPFSGDEASA